MIDATAAAAAFRARLLAEQIADERAMCDGQLAEQIADERATRAAQLSLSAEEWDERIVALEAEERAACANLRDARGEWVPPQHLAWYEVEQVRQRLALARNWAWHAEIARMEGMDDANTDTMVSTTPENVQALFNRLTEEAR